MAWSTPRTWVTGETVTAALMNAHVRDNLDFLEAQRVILNGYATTKNLWIGNWQPRETNGAAGSQVLTASPNYYNYLAFDASTKEYAWANVPMPVNYNGGTITARFYWSHPATTTNFKVRWAIAATSMTNAEALNTALGTAVGVNDTGGTTDTLYVTDSTGDITIAGSPDDYHLVHFDVYRVADDATNDTLAVDAYLLGVLITYGIG